MACNSRDDANRAGARYPFSRFTAITHSQNLHSGHRLTATGLRTQPALKQLLPIYAAYFSWTLFGL
jgi:hypothetical protein